MSRPLRTGRGSESAAPHPGGDRHLHLPNVNPETFHQLAAGVVGCYALLVVTGGAVRLTGSGLGCPDWPTCYRDRVTPALSLQPLVEFSNRLVTVAVTIVTLAVFAAALRRVPRRGDLVSLSAAIVAGLLAQVVLGGLVVLFKLNPYLVALHFLLTLLVLAVALVLWHRSDVEETPAVNVVGNDLVVLSRIVVAALALVITLGTVVSGSGPHAGGSGAKRIAIAFRDAAELHSSAALFVIGLVLALLFALHVGRAPATVQRRARTLLELLALQGTLGYTQYLLHDAAVVIEFHLAGATAVWCTAVTYYLSLHCHPDPSPDARRAEVGEVSVATLVVPAVNLR